MPPVVPRAQSGRTEARTVVQLPRRVTDEELIALLLSNPLRARAAIFDRYAADIERVLCRVLGPDSELLDLLHDVFITAFGSIHKLQDNSKLRSWLIGIAVHQARRLIRRRKLRRLVRSMAPFDLPEQEAISASIEVTEALRETYSILSCLPTDERIAFALRCIDGMDLGSIAQATGVSVATVKRRIQRGQQSFTALARENDVLCDWLERGTLGE
jgi:RNA polymerase sigma-70 factor, ECF subfamily